MSWYLNTEGIQIEKEYLTTSDHDVSIESLTKLADQFDWAEIHTTFNQPPPGTMGMMIPHSYVVIKVPRFLRGFAQTILSIWWIGSTSGDGLDRLVGGGWAAFDGFERMIAAIKVLNENQGEYCTYQAALEATGKSILERNTMTSAPEIWDIHATIRESCPVSTCQFFQKGCQIKRVEFDEVLEKLTISGQIEKDGIQMRAAW